MSKLISIGEASKELGVSISTLRRWEVEGRIASKRTAGNQRRYDVVAARRQSGGNLSGKKLTIAYARVSSHDQKSDLEVQKQALSLYCAKKKWKFEVIADLGSGMNYRKKGLKKLLHYIIDGQISRLVITHKDRLLRFGSELVFLICEAKDVEVVIINKNENATFEEDLAKDVLEIITVFSARLYGSRSHKNKKMVSSMEADSK